MPEIEAGWAMCKENALPLYYLSGPWIYFVIDFGFGATPTVLRAWLCAQGSLLAVLKGPYGALEIKPK